MGLITIYLLLKLMFSHCEISDTIHPDKIFLLRKPFQRLWIK